MSAIQQRRRASISGRAQAGNRGRDWRKIAVGAGYVGLLISLATLLITFSGWLLVILAGVSTALLSVDRRLGPLPAAMLVMLALPVGRGAEVGLALIGDVPIRPHDAAALVGAALVLPGALAAVRRPARLLNPMSIPFTVFLLVGVAALVLGMLDANALRDVVRDTRWWSLYAIGLLAILTRTTPDGIVRALVWGMTLYATVILTAMLLPAFPAGLKLGAYLYDDRMRLHYGQAILLLPLASFAATRALRRPIPWVAVLGLAAAAASITLTRALMAAVVGVVVLAVVWSLLRAHRARRSERSRPATVRTFGPRVAAVLLALAVGLGGGVGAYTSGIRIWIGTDSNGDVGPTTDRPVVDASERIGGQEGSDLGSQAIGRLPSYARAFVETSGSPLLGNGIGQLTFVSWTRGEYAGHTRNAQPGVDNAFLTVGLKAGALGIAAFAVLVLWPLRQFLAVPRRRLWAWYLPAWLGILGLSLIESFAVSGYTPFTLSMLIALPLLDRNRRAS
ncbi:MAG: hypothetical protein ACR2GO_00165, partial [Candidatus Limnocylindria bacterium]